MKTKVIAFVVVASPSFWSTPTSAVTADVTCENAKLHAVQHYQQCLLRAYKRANVLGGAHGLDEETGLQLSERDIAFCDERFDRAFERAEARGACETAGGPSSLREAIKAEVATTVETVRSETGCATLTIEDDRAVCEVDTKASAIDLENLVDELSDLGVDEDTTLWIESWGPPGSRGNVEEQAGRGGEGGYAQTTTTFRLISEQLGATVLFYYLGRGGDFNRNSGGDGGAATLVTVNDLTQEDLTIAGLIHVAGGGGGGGAGRGKRVCPPEGKKIKGEPGGRGATAIEVFGTAIVAGEHGGFGRPSHSGQGGQTTTGGASSGGSSEDGDGPVAPLGGLGGNRTDATRPGFINQPNTEVTGGGGRGSSGGNDAGGGGGGGGWTGGGGGDRGVSSTNCTSGGGGGGSSFARELPTSPSCAATPTERPFNPTGGRDGFVRISFDLGACENALTD